MSLQWREYSRATACPPMSLFMLTIDQANRSVSLLGTFHNQTASATCQAAWLRNTSLLFILELLSVVRCCSPSLVFPTGLNG